MTVRVRFSPAPTGFLHVGSARAALFNWLYARHAGGTFVLRIEDTDTERTTEAHVEAIGENLRWLGIDWDETYRQSDRFDQYMAAANSMFERGLAYRCDCTPDVVQARLEAAGVAKGSGYDGFCRDRSVEPGPGVVMRFRTPDEGTTSWEDVVRGKVSFENALLEDFIIVRSNGTPMFHVANAYDDMDMAITHVVRGEDLVNTTPRVLLLRAAMGGGEPPAYAHLPLIVNERRKKLSKRRDDVSVGDYRDKGYLAEAMRNYLVTLGWGPKDGVEIRPVSELVEQFELADINAAPAFFDIKKLDHFNATYIRELSADDFVAQATPYSKLSSPELIAKFGPELQERAKRLTDIDGMLAWIVGGPAEPSAKDWKKAMGAEGVADVLDGVIDGMESVEWTPDSLEKLVFGIGEKLGRRSQVPVRVAVTGSRAGLPLFAPMAELERGEVLARLRAARSRL